MKRPRSSLGRGAAATALCLVAILAGAGCGEGGSVADGATVTVYVAKALCGEAKEALADEGGKAGKLRVRAICVPSAEAGRRLDLAQIGANARRAAEDSGSVGYIGEPTRAASRFAATILAEVGIRQYAAMRGGVAMRRLLRTLREDSPSLRLSR